MWSGFIKPFLRNLVTHKKFGFLYHRKSDGITKFLKHIEFNDLAHRYILIQYKNTSTSHPKHFFSITDEFTLSIIKSLFTHNANFSEKNEKGEVIPDKSLFYGMTSVGRGFRGLQKLSVGNYEHLFVIGNIYFQSLLIRDADINDTFISALIDILNFKNDMLDKIFIANCVLKDEVFLEKMFQFFHHVIVIDDLFKDHDKKLTYSDTAFQKNIIKITEEKFYQEYANEYISLSDINQFLKTHCR